MALKLNEGRACEAIVRHLEKREKVTRTNLRFPEQEQHVSPVEAAFTLGDQRYALEHTGIEPFEGHMKMEAQADQRFTPIIDGLNSELDTTATFELAIPAEAFEGRKNSERKDIQQRLIEWVKARAPTIPKPLLRGYRGRSTGSENVPGVPFAVYLSRHEPVLVPGRHFQIKHLIPECARVDRMTKAVNDKFPKLAAWKRNDNAKTILVLESNDIQLTSPVNVMDTFMPLAKARPDQPDETYLVMSCTDPWLVFPISVGGKTYVDLVTESDSESDVHWTIDPATLTSLTKR